ncbi:MAG TPA: choice-of-anchor D domain-containing protein [Spirochaetia bacterium]|nr:choice-of-anchor D domain-containing protein [Spirochaetia bacterium]
MKKNTFAAACGLLVLLTLASCDSKMLGLLQTDVRNSTTPKIPSLAVDVSGATVTNNSTVNVLPVVVNSSRLVSVTLRNTGNGPLEITSNPKLTISGSSAFALSSAEPGSPLLPGASESFSITFSPTAVGTYSTTITLKSNATGGADFAFTLSSSSFSSDTILPTGAIAIEGGLAATNSSLVLLNLTASDNNGVEKMWISNSSTFATGAWEAYSSTKSGWPLTAGVSSADGVKTVYVKYRDVAGNESIPYSDTIKYDTTKPVGSSVRVAEVSGASTSYPLYITNPNGVANVSVRLEPLATDATSGVAQMMISNDSNFTNGSWVAYSTSYQHALTTGFGLKTFYAKFRDAVGYESTPISGTVYLDDAYEASFGNGDGDDPYTLYTSERGSTYYYNSTSSPSALANQFYTQDYPGYAVLNDVDRYWIYADTTMDTLHVGVQIVNGGSGPVYLELRDLNDLNPIYGTGSATAKSVELYVSGGIPQGWYTIRISGPANSGQQYNLSWWTDWTGI